MNLWVDPFELNLNQVHAFCCDTGLVLAVFAGHALTVNCMLWIQSQVLTGAGWLRYEVCQAFFACHFLVLL